MLSEDILEQLLDSMSVARLGLIGKDGRPESMPIVFVRVGELLFSPIDGKPKSSAKLARIEHIEKNPSGTLLIDHYQDDWEQLWWVRLDVEAEVIRGEHAAWDSAVLKLKDKYSQYQTVPLFQGDPTMITLRYTRIRWWASNGVNSLNRWLDS